MKKIVFTLLVLAVGLMASMIEKKSSFDFKTTVANMEKNIEQNGFMIYAKIDHKANATKVGSYSPNAVTFIYANPKDTARIMMHDSKASFDLPQKVLIYDDIDDKTIVVYEPFKDLKTRYEVSRCQIVDTISEKIDKMIESSIK